MKKYFLFLLFLSLQTHAWYSTNNPLHFALNTHADFGKKHFIIGYTPHKQPVVQTHKATGKNAHNLIDKNGQVKKALFAPHDDVRATLLYLIGQEKKQISIAMFAFTDKDFAHALAQAQQRGVQVEIVVDPSNVYGRYNKLTHLHKSNIDIFVYNPSSFNKKIPGAMHNKFVVFGKNIQNKSLVWTGSFNFTRAAHQRNQENVVVLDDQEVVQKFSGQFQELKKYTDVYHAPMAAQMAANR